MGVDFGIQENFFNAVADGIGAQSALEPDAIAFEGVLELVACRSHAGDAGILEQVLPKRSGVILDEQFEELLPDNPPAFGGANADAVEQERRRLGEGKRTIQRSHGLILRWQLGYSPRQLDDGQFGKATEKFVTSSLERPDPVVDAYLPGCEFGQGGIVPVIDTAPDFIVEREDEFAQVFDVLSDVFEWFHGVFSLIKMEYHRQARRRETGRAGCGFFCP